MKMTNRSRWSAGVALGVVLAGGALVQADDTPQQQPAQPAPTEKRVHRRDVLRRIAKELEFTDDQKKAVDPILKSYNQKIRDIRKNATLDGTQKRDQIRALYPDLQKELEPQLTDTQKQKLTDIVAEATAPPATR